MRLNSVAGCFPCLFNWPRWALAHRPLLIPAFAKKIPLSFLGRYLVMAASRFLNSYEDDEVFILLFYYFYFCVFFLVFLFPCLCLTFVLISSRFRPDFVPISSWFHPNFIPILSQFHPDFIPISSQFRFWQFYFINSFSGGIQSEFIRTF